MTIPIDPPTKDAIVVMKSATPARPFWAIGYPSRQVTADDVAPGMFSRMDAVDPP